MIYVPYLLAMFGFFLMCFVSLFTFGKTNDALHMATFAWNLMWINIVFVMMMKRYYKEKQ